MDVSEIIQSILTYFLTAGFVSTIAYFFHLSKRVTILEEHDKVVRNTIEKIDGLVSSLTDKLARIDTKLDLILEGKIKNNTKDGSK